LTLQMNAPPNTPMKLAVAFGARSLSAMRSAAWADLRRIRHGGRDDL
jgi:hypothetical protein